MQDVHVKLNPGLPQQKQHSTRRCFSPAISEKFWNVVLETDEEDYRD